MSVASTRASATALLAACALLALGAVDAAADDEAPGAKTSADPLERVRSLGVDAILVHTWKEISRDPAMGDGVVWIDDAREVESLLRPLSARWGPQFACGYDVVFEFLRDGSVVAEHALNVQEDCMEYAADEGSFVFRGDLARRWSPLLQRMRGPTGQWDVDIAFPVTTPFAEARAAVVRAGLAVVDLPKDDLRRLPWVRLSHRAAVPRDMEEEEALKIAALPLMELARRACASDGCRPDSPRMRGDESRGTDRFLTVEVLVRFPERGDVEPLLHAAAAGGFDVADSFVPADRFLVRCITSTRPTPEGCAKILASVDGALSVVGGSLSAHMDGVARPR